MRQLVRDDAVELTVERPQLSPKTPHPVPEILRVRPRGGFSEG